MSDVAPEDLDAACLAAVVGAGEVPMVGNPPERMHPIRLHTAAIRALAGRVAGLAPDDGIRLSDLVRYQAEPGDVIVAWVPALTAPEHVERIRAELRRAFGTNAVVVSCGIGIEVINASDVAGTIGGVPIVHDPAMDASGMPPILPVP